MSGVEIQLKDFQDGKPVVFHGQTTMVSKIAALKAKKNYKKLLQLSYELPNNPDTYLLRATTLLHLKEWSKLIDCCNNGILLKEDQSEFYNLKGKAFGKLGNQEEKIALIEIALSINEQVPAYHRNLGAAHYSLKNYEQAIISHTIAIKLEPENPINYHNKGASLFRMKNYEEAKVYFSRAFEKDPKLALSYSWLGDCERQLGNPEEAIRLYEQAYNISGNMVYYKEKQKLQEKTVSKKKKKFFGLF